MTQSEQNDRFWMTVFRTVVAGYHWFVPVIIINWVMVEAVASQVPRAPALAQAGIFLICVDYYLAAAVRALDLQDTNPLRMAFWRTGAAMKPLMLAMALGLFTVLCLAPFFYFQSTAAGVAGVGVSAVAILYTLARTWPMWGIPYFFKGEYVYSPAAGGTSWSGPGIGLALQLTREKGLFNVHSRRFMLAFIVLAAVWIGIEWALPPSVLPQAIVYMLGLPVLSVAAVSGVRDLLGDRADSSSPGLDHRLGQ
jgi:hypothetical protein